MGRTAQRMADGVTATEILPATADAILVHLCHGAGNIAPNPESIDNA